MGFLKAFKSETKAPPKGEQEALELYEQGRRYMAGDGVEKDVEKAVLLYHQALGRWEIPQLDFEVGRCYALGIGVERDKEEAKRLLQRCSVEIPEAAKLLVEIYREDGNPQIALYFASVAMLAYPEVAEEAEALASGAAEGRKPSEECLEILRRHALYAQENSVYRYVVDLIASLTGSGIPNLDYVVNSVLNLYIKNPLWLWKGKDQDFWVVLAMQFAEGSAELHLEASVESALAAAGVALASAFRPEEEMPRPRLLRREVPAELDQALRALRSGDFSQPHIDALRSFADGGNYYAAAELYFLSDYITSEQGTGPRRREQLRQQGCPAYSGNGLLMMSAALEDFDTEACKQLALMLSGKAKEELRLPNEMASKLLAGVYLSAAARIDAGLESVCGDMRAAMDLADIYGDIIGSKGDHHQQMARCVNRGYAPAVIAVIPGQAYDRTLWGSSEYDRYHLPDAHAALSALPYNFFDRDAHIDGLKAAKRKDRQQEAQKAAARRAQAERMVRPGMGEKLDRQERRWNTLIVGVPVTNQELFGSAMIMGIEGATESYVLSDISREGTIRGAIRKKQRELADADYRQKVEERIASQPTATGRISSTCFVDEKQAGYWMSGTLIGMTLGMLGCLGGFNYAGANERYARLLNMEGGLDHLMLLKYLCRMGHKLALADLEHYRPAALLWHEPSIVKLYQKDPNSEIGREMLRRAAYLGVPEARLDQAKVWIQLGENLEQAVRVLREFADGGNSDAQALLATCYVHGIGVQKDPGAALARMRGEAEKGSGVACWQMGSYYEQGVGVEPDLEQALSWYEKAADLKSGPAILRLARARLNGELGLRKDFRKALVCAVRGVVTGDADCIEFFNSLTPEQAGNLRGYYAPKMRKRTPGFFSAPSAENRACKKVIKDIESDFIYYSKYLVTAAESGFAEAQWMLGLVYGLGKGVERDLYQAFYWFEQSAALGYLPALEEVTLMLNMQNDFHNAALAEHYYDFAIEMGSTRKDLAAALIVPDPPEVKAAEMYQRALAAEQKEDFQEALWCFRRAMECGHLEGQYMYGWYLETGKGDGKKNEELAVKLYTEAAKQGHAGAMYRLSLCCENGWGTPRAPAAAREWLRKAAEAGCVEALQNQVWELVKAEKYEEAFPLLQKGIEIGDSYCMVVQGFVYHDGLGVERDLAEAIRWYERAAQAGSKLGQAEAGHAYEHGRGVEKDEAKALYWYEKAAENGDVDSMVRAAVFYKDGRGTEVNWEAAFRWYERAAQAGNAEGEFYAGFCYCMPRGMEQRDLKKGVYWYEKAVAQGHTIAMFNLGWMYAMGNGVPQDIERGVRLFRELLDKGDFRGKFSIGRCLVEGIGMEADREAGFKLIREAAPKYERARKYLEKYDPDSTKNP